MSAATALNPTAKAPLSENGATHSPVDYVRGLSQEDKGKVLVALLREAMEQNEECGVMPIDDDDGKPFGYYVPPKSMHAPLHTLPPVLTNEQREVSIHALANLSDTFDMNEFLDELKTADELPDSQR